MKKIIKKISIFDWIIIFIVLSGIIFYSSQIFKKESWIEIKMKVRPQSLWWDYKPAPYWVIDSINKGDVQYSNSGEKIAEVIDTELYEWGGGRKEIYATINIKTNFHRKRNIHRFNNQIIQVGGPVVLELSGVRAEGLVMEIQGQELDQKAVEKIVETKMEDIYPWVAESINVGDQMKNSKGEIIAEILSKKEELAQMVVTTDTGNVLLRRNPIKRDLYLTIKLKTLESRGQYYFREDSEIKINHGLWIKLPDISIDGAIITKILQ